jgi:hypothetical protein
MRDTFVQFRGAPRLVEFVDHGYEPDTNAHEIEWWFTDKELNGLATDEEQAAIDWRLSEIVAEDGSDEHEPEFGEFA